MLKEKTGYKEKIEKLIAIDRKERSATTVSEKKEARKERELLEN